MKRLAALVVALTCLIGLAACDDTGSGSDSGSGTDPVEVEVGKAFEWNDFAVEDGWKLKGVDRAVDIEQVTTPEVSGTIVNKSAEARAAIFQLVFSADGAPLSTVNCSAAKMPQDASTEFICPGINTVMPTGYDTVVVQKFVRDSDESDTSGNS